MENDKGPNQLQLESFNEIIGSLKGLTKRVAVKIINDDFLEAVKKILNSYGVKDASDAIKKLLDISTQKATNVIQRKFLKVLTLIIGFFTVVASILTLAFRGNVIIPVVVSALIIVIIWIVTNQISKLIARRVSDRISTFIEGKITQITANKYQKEATHG